MRLNIAYIFALVFSFSFVSCNEGQNNTDSKQTLVKSSNQYSKDNTTVEWTAFKTTDRVAVKGRFNEFLVQSKSDASSAVDLLNSVKFKIPINSLSTGNEGRDYLIKSFFFGSMINTDTIYGSFSDASNQKVNISLLLNDVNANIEANLVIKGDSVLINCNLNLEKWNGLEAVNSLNEKCYEVHKGPDGVSKTWADVDVSIVSVLK